MGYESLALIIPVALFVCVTLVVLGHFYFRHRDRQLVLQALQTSLDKTGSADQNLLAALAIEKTEPGDGLAKRFFIFGNCNCYGIVRFVSSAKRML